MTKPSVNRVCNPSTPATSVYLIPIVLACLTLIGAILRLYHLDYNSLWLDETSTYAFSNMSPTATFEAVLHGEWNPPLFYWLEHAVIMIMGADEFTLRLIPAIAGTLTIPAFYLLGKEVYDDTTGILMAVYATISPYFVFYSQDARTYMVLIFVYTIALVCYLKALSQGGKTNRYWIVTGIVCSIACWLHFYACIGVAIITLHALVTIYQRYRREFAFYSGAGSYIAAFTIPSLPLFYVLLTLVGKRVTQGVSWGQSSFQAISEFFYFNAFMAEYLVVAFVVLFGIGYIIMIRDRWEVATLCTIGLIGILGATLFVADIIDMHSRYMMFCAPFAIIPVMGIFHSIPEVTARRVWCAVFIIILVIPVVPFYGEYYTQYTKNDWRGMTSDLTNATTPGDWVVLLPAADQKQMAWYYDNVSDGTTLRKTNTQAGLEAIVAEWQEGGTGKIYFVKTENIYLYNNKSHSVTEWLQKRSQYLGQYAIRMEIYGGVQ